MEHVGPLVNWLLASIPRHPPFSQLPEGSELLTKTLCSAASGISPTVGFWVLKTSFRTCTKLRNLLTSIKNICTFPIHFQDPWASSSSFLDSLVKTWHMRPSRPGLCRPRQLVFISNPHWQMPGHITRHTLPHDITAFHCFVPSHVLFSTTGKASKLLFILQSPARELPPLRLGLWCCPDRLDHPAA